MKVQVTPEIDNASLTKGTVARVVYDIATQVETEYLETGVDVGQYVKLTATVTDSGNDHFVGWFGNTTSTDNPLIVLASETLTYTAKFGGTATISAPRAKYNQSPVAEVANASAGASSTDGYQVPVATYLFTYGETIRLRAISGADAFFAGWYDVYTTSSQSLQRMDLSADCEYTPTATFTLVPVFSRTAMPFYIKMTNSGATSYGSLLLSSIGKSVTEISKTVFNDDIDLRYGADGGLHTLVLELFDNDNGLDRYVVLGGSDLCVIKVRLLTESVTFKKWQVSQINPVFDVNGDPAGYASTTPVDLSTSNETEIEIASDCILYALYNSDEATKIIVDYETGSNATMGNVLLSPVGDNYLEGPPAQGDYFEGSDVSATAEPMNGFKFVGWYNSAGSLISALGEYTFTVESGGALVTLLARFEQEDDAIYEWEGDTATSKLATWKSKRYLSTVPFNPACARVYADGYDSSTSLSVKVGTSPNVEQNSNSASIVVASEAVRRLPQMRPEKYIEIEVKSAFPVTEVAVSTSMEGLLNG
jgi:hypothetical protein